MCISIDSSLKSDIQKLFPHEVSSKINDYLKRLIAYANNDLGKINKLKLVRELDDIYSQISNLEVKRDFMQEQLDKINDSEKVEESKRIELEDKKAVERVKCSVCRIPKPNDKMHRFPGGLVCKSCFMDSENKKVIRQLNLSS